ncbi:Atu4866 domain-containing protein, partial [Streptomyces sp. NPDC055078]
MTHTPVSTNPNRDDTVLRQIRDFRGRPLLLTGGTVITGNPLMGDWQQADVLIGGPLVVGVGPGLLTAAEDDNMIVIDCAGTVVLPSGADLSGSGGHRTLTPGESADITVLRLADAPGTPAGAVPARGTHLDVVITAGEVRRWNGLPLAPEATDTAAAERLPTSDAHHPYTGMWVDENGFVRQELLPGGRYDEARGDRQSAYQGRYWINGNRIDYLDDLGFWAFGEFQGDTLHH